MFNRKEVIESLGYDNNWQTVKTWIQDMVSREPKIMRQVSNARFGDLGQWIQKGRSNISPGFCGCLVGTTALALVEDRNHFKPIDRWTEFVRSNEPEEDQFGVSSAEVVCELAHVENDAYEAGIAASELQITLGQDQAVALIKSEIKEQLRLRSRRVLGGRMRAKSAKRTKAGTFKRVA